MFVSCVMNAGMLCECKMMTEEDGGRMQSQKQVPHREKAH